MNNFAPNQFPTPNPGLVVQKTTGYTLELLRPFNTPAFIGLTSTNADLNQMVQTNTNVRIPRFRHNSVSVPFNPATDPNIPAGESAAVKDQISFDLQLDIVHAERATIDHQVLQQSYNTDPVQEFGRVIQNTLNAAIRKLTVRLQRRFLENTYKCFGDTAVTDSPIATLAQLQQLQLRFARERTYSDARELILITDEANSIAIRGASERNDRSVFPEEARENQIERLVRILGINGYSYIGQFGRFFIFVDEDLAFNPLPYDQGPESNAAGAVPAATIYVNGKLSVRANTDFLNLERQSINDGGNGILLRIPVTTVGTSRSSLYIPRGALFTVTGIGAGGANNAGRVFTVTQDLVIRPSYTAATGVAVTQTTGFLVVAGLPTDVERGGPTETSITADTDITFLGHMNTSFAFERESVVIANRVLLSHRNQISNLANLNQIVQSGGEHRFNNRFSFPSAFIGTTSQLNAGSIVPSGLDYGLKFISADTRTELFLTMITSLVNTWPEFCVKVLNGVRPRINTVDPNDTFTDVPTTIGALMFRT